MSSRGTFDVDRGAREFGAWALGPIEVTAVGGLTARPTKGGEIADVGVPFSCACALTMKANKSRLRNATVAGIERRTET